MTLKELWMVVVRRWKMIVAVVLVCLVACGGYLVVKKAGPAGYTATSYVVGNSQAAGVLSLANDEARKLTADMGDGAFKIESKIDSGSTTVVVTATGADAGACIDAANAVAEAANEAAKDRYSSWESPYYGSVTLAVEVEEDAGGSSISNMAKYLLVALLAGLFISVCIAVLLDMKRRPVKTPEGVQELVELPVLEVLPVQNGERLLANVRFAGTREAGDSGKEISSVLVLPSGDVETAQGACELLTSAAASEGSTLNVQQAMPLPESMAGAYAARDADAVVVTARQWVDSLPQLETTVAELRLAGANLTGVVFAGEKF